MLSGFFDIIRGKRILLTGHTGFKGSWMATWLLSLGALVTGYSLENEDQGSNFIRSGIKNKMGHIIGDIRDEKKLCNVFLSARPDAVIHMAAQPIVKHSFFDPRYTYDVNVMGTLNVLEQFRKSESCRAAVIITSDKCYENNEWVWGYRENDRIGGSDIYSSSKGCAELLVSSYRRSFLDEADYQKHGKLLITARAGNVIGGGDWADYRIVPDCIRSLLTGEDICIRNPEATRPWQHVLDPLFGYLLLLKKAFEGDVSSSGAWNFGPDFLSVVTVMQLVGKLISAWGSGEYSCIKPSISIPESGFLNLDSSKAKSRLNWQPIWDIDTAIEKTVEWYRNFKDVDVYSMCKDQISCYCNDIKNIK